MPTGRPRSRAAAASLRAGDGRSRASRCRSRDRRPPPRRQTGGGRTGRPPQRLFPSPLPAPRPSPGAGPSPGNHLAPPAVQVDREREGRVQARRLGTTSRPTRPSRSTPGIPPVGADYRGSGPASIARPVTRAPAGTTPACYDRWRSRECPLAARGRVHRATNPGRYSMPLSTKGRASIGRSPGRRIPGEHTHMTRSIVPRTRPG
jgi:hypothetical protein